VLRLASVLTQLCSASCLLLGTIAFVLVQQNKTGGAAYVVAWCVAALAGLVLGGLMVRGGMISLIGSVVVDLGFGVVLLVVLDDAALRGLVTVLPASDLEMIAQIVVGIGGAMLAVAVLCLVAIPQALRYAWWLQGHADAPSQTAPFLAAAPSVTATRPSRPGALRPTDLRDEPILAGSTAKGWAPPTAKITVWNLPKASPEERRSRRRLYIALAGFAIGFGAGIGALVSSSARSSAPGAPVAGSAAIAIPPGAGSATVDTPAGGTGSAAAVASPNSGSAADGPIGEGGSLEDVPSVQRFVEAQRAAIAKGDLAALAAMLAPTAFGFGVEADALAETRGELAAQLARDLGEPAAGGFTVEQKFVATGEEGSHAWIAMELAVVSPDGRERRFAITELATVVDRAWSIVAWHWAVPVPDATAERRAILGTSPRPKAVPDVATAPPELEAAARAAFASRTAFAAARSERADGFNFGSAPGERVVGGARVKALFDRLRFDIRVHDGLRVHAVSETVGVAAANIDLTSKTRAATDLTQTLRVLAVFVKEGPAWKLVQTQWSHGGPIR